MQALIDADIVAFRVGFTTNEGEDLYIATSRLNTLMTEILTKTESDADFKVFLSPQDDSNFRYKIYPEYKANRTAPRPKWLPELRALLVADYGAEIAHGMEADDLLGMNQTDTSIICTIDKDLNQVPGWHYNFVKGEMYEVDDIEALRSFYMQLLTGDTVDNVPGAKGIGPKKAEKILAGLEDEPDLQQAVFDTYCSIYGDKAMELMVKYGQVLYIKRSLNDMWTPNYLEHEVS